MDISRSAGVFAAVVSRARATVLALRDGQIVGTDAPLPVSGPAAATREYSQAGVRVAVTDSGTAAHALPTLGASREVRLMSNVRCFIRFGVPQAAPNGALLDTAATVGATSFPLAADLPEVVRVPAGATHFAAICDGTTNGNITLHAVA